MSGVRVRLSALAASTAILAAAMVLVPVSFDRHHGFDTGKAMAGNSNGGGHGNGGSNGNGNGGGNGNGNSNGNSNGSSNGNGNGSSNGNSASHANNGNGQTNGNGSGLGALNAAHASPNAFANASANSRVGRIRAYEEALNKYLDDVTQSQGCTSGCPDLPADISSVAQALAAASNKTLTTDALNQLNGLLGVDPTVTDTNWSSTTAQDIVDQANATP